ncbi:MAG: ATP-binding protein [Acidobacteriota bacterium]
MALWLAVTLLGAYALCMLGVAQWVERSPALKARIASSPLVYTLSLTVYMTAWTYYGIVGQAANNGLVFLTSYLGPTLLVLLWPMILGRILRLKKTIRITSIADYLGARYGRSHLVAGMAASLALMGSLPYIALQIKAVLSSLAVLTGQGQHGPIGSAGASWAGASWAGASWAGPGLMVFLVAFIIVAGVRRIDPTERHQGVMAVIALESMVKLVGFLAVGGFVCYVMFESPWEIFRRAQAVSLGHLLTVGGEGRDYQDWVGRMLLFMPVILLLPRQFHVAVVENSEPRHLRTAVWLFPLYMLLISMFVMPIALGGRLLGFEAQAGDTFVLLLPRLGGSAWLSFLVFLGGFSAAMSMIAVNTMTMATMVTNDLILPLAARIPGADWVRRSLLPLRWVVVTAYLGCGYLVHLAIGENTMLASMGIMSMAAAAQFTPAAILGLFWRGGTKAGAVAGLGAGFAVWLYTLALPALARSGVITSAFLDGPLGISWLAPENLFGLSVLTPLNHSLFWAMILNTGGYVLVSLLKKPCVEEAEMTLHFFGAASGAQDVRTGGDSPRHVLLAPRLAVLEEMFRAYLPRDAARDYVEASAERSGCSGLDVVSVLELTALYAEAEKSLGGIVGAASAHKAVLDERLYTVREREELSSVYGRVLADMKVSPDELRRRVDYYQEREALLMENAQALTAANQALEAEVLVRRQFELEARQAEEKYRSIFDNAVEGIFQTSLDGRILDANPSCARILGYDSPAELMESVVDIGSGIYAKTGDREQFLSFLRANGVVSNFETVFIRKDGRQVWITLHAKAIFGEDGSLARIEGILEDISERKLAEDRTRQANQAVRGIIDSMPSAMIALSGGTRVFHLNREAAARFGMSTLEAEGKRLGELVPGLAWTLDLVDKALESGEPQFKGRVGDDSGPARRYIDVMAYPLAGRGDVVLRIDDVTERVRVEDMMVQTEKMFSVGGLAAGMAHEINNPLGAIVGSAQNMERRLEAGRPRNEEAAALCGVSVDAVRCYLQKRGVLDMVGLVREAGFRASEIVRNMLEFSRKSEGRMALEDVPALLEKSVELAGQDYDLKKKFDFRQIHMVRDYEPDLPRVECSATEITQVFLNLLRNAAQAFKNPDGGEGWPEIRLRVRREGEMVRIEVADNGPGMDEATRKRVFEPFFTTKPVGIGTGLGLSVSYFIVTDNHGGQFSVESSPGKGARFIVRLPLTQAAR